MKIRFSKPLGDIAAKSREQRQTDDSWLARVRRATAELENRPPRAHCPVCRSDSRQATSFVHRGLSYLRCPTCGHVMLACLPPEGYPRRQGENFAFNAVYPDQEAAARRQRRRMIYRPKLDWILDAACATGQDRDALLNARWTELGCGDGQFLSALEEAGASRLTGYEADAGLAGRAARELGVGRVVHSGASLAEVVRQDEAEVYAAFFVLEHIPDVHAVFRAFAEKPPGTLLAFSVPVFSLATVLESAFDVHAPRNLDSVLHTQLFTDASIRRCLELGGLRPVSQWVFGQDAADLRRLLSRALAPVYPAELVDEVDIRLAAMEDGLQQVVDRAFFCDARHVLAVRGQDEGRLVDRNAG